MAKVYIDTGIFIDFLSQHALGGALLRTGPRRARTPASLTRDAGNVLTAIGYGAYFNAVDLYRKKYGSLFSS